MEVEITKTFDHLGTNYQVGQICHVENSIAADFIHHKVAKRREYKSFKEAMDAQEKQRIATLPPNSNFVGWSIKETMAAPYSGAPRVLVVKTTPHETLYFNAPPADAPQFIKQRFADAIATDAAQFTARGEFLQRQAREPRTINGYSEFDILRVKK